eukprot:366465-Chlamydomonas_euryale.AAC.21
MCKAAPQLCTASDIDLPCARAPTRTKHVQAPGFSKHTRCGRRRCPYTRRPGRQGYEGCEHQRTWRWLLRQACSFANLGKRGPQLSSRGSAAPADRDLPCSSTGQRAITRLPTRLPWLRWPLRCCRRAHPLQLLPVLRDAHKVCLQRAHVLAPSAALHDACAVLWGVGSRCGVGFGRTGGLWAGGEGVGCKREMKRGVGPGMERSGGESDQIARRRQRSVALGLGRAFAGEPPDCSACVLKAFAFALPPTADEFAASYGSFPLPSSPLTSWASTCRRGTSEAPRVFR